MLTVPMVDGVMMAPLLWTLVAAQIAMGGFDVIFHHEITERLAWKDNAANELRLHAWRNVFYGVLFAVFAWVQPLGWLAVALIAILLVEIVITLWDFVEEDMTRKLPPSERVLHTLLAINYGAILALIAPEIVRWAHKPTGVELANYGWVSAILTCAALGVFAFAMRDFYTSRRVARLAPKAPVALDDVLPGARRHVLVTGGTGFVGSHLVAALTRAGHAVTVLTRSPAHAGHLAAPVRLVTSLEQIAPSERIDAVVDLAGEPIAGGLWTRRRRFNIIASRVRTTRAVHALIARLAHAPSVYIKASAIGIYGPRDGDGALDEMDALGPDAAFTVRTCEAVEDAANRVAELGVRTVALRIGLVLDRDAGLLARMIPPFDLALGGPIGTGRQWMSWIAVDDLVRLIAFSIAHDRLEGPVNATAPRAVRNADFAAALGRALCRPAVLRVPAWPLRSILGGFADELLLTGQQVVPVKARLAGFRFQFPTLDAALAHAVGIQPAGRPAPRQAGADEERTLGTRLAINVSDKRAAL